jgi:hypothetical protein
VQRVRLDRALTSDTTNGAINLSGAGEASKTIRWFARFDMAEKAAH